MKKAQTHQLRLLQRARSLSYVTDSRLKAFIKGKVLVVNTIEDRGTYYRITKKNKEVLYLSKLQSMDFKNYGVTTRGEKQTIKEVA